MSYLKIILLTLLASGTLTGGGLWLNSVKEEKSLESVATITSKGETIKNLTVICKHSTSGAFYERSFTLNEKPDSDKKWQKIEWKVTKTGSDSKTERTERVVVDKFVDFDEISDFLTSSTCHEGELITRKDEVSKKEITSFTYDLVNLECYHTSKTTWHAKYPCSKEESLITSKIYKNNIKNGMENSKFIDLSGHQFQMSTTAANPQQPIINLRVWLPHNVSVGNCGPLVGGVSSEMSSFWNVCEIS